MPNNHEEPISVDITTGRAWQFKNEGMSKRDILGMRRVVQFQCLDGGKLVILLDNGDAYMRERNDWGRDSWRKLDWVNDLIKFYEK